MCFYDLNMLYTEECFCQLCHFTSSCHLLQRYLSGCGALLRFLAMIWTAPLDAKLVGGASVDPMLQGCGLGIGSAYIMALDGRAAVALVTEHCPGGCGLRRGLGVFGHQGVIRCVSMREVLGGVATWEGLSAFTSCNISSCYGVFSVLTFYHRSSRGRGR